MALESLEHTLLLRAYCILQRIYYSIQQLKSMLRQNRSKMDLWLTYAPLLYSHLLIYPVPHFKNINQVRWLRGVSNSKSSFKFHQGFICLSGAVAKQSKTGNAEGAYSIFKCSIPIGQQLDDDRLEPTIKMRSHWIFQQQIKIIQQYANNLEDQDINNMFAIGYKNQPTAVLISTRKLLEQGFHNNQYADAGETKLLGHKMPITSMRWANFQSGGHKLFTSSQDSSIIQWDIEKIVLQRSLKYHKESVKQITPLFNALSSTWGIGPIVQSNTDCLASVSIDGNIFIWDQRTATPVSKISGRQKQLHAIDNVNNTSILTGGSDGTIKFWDLRQFKQYLYESKLDKNCGHSGIVNLIKVNRYQNQQLEKADNNSKKQKNSSQAKIKFTSSGDDGKIIEWKDKFSFSHEGHQSVSNFDTNQINPLCTSTEIKKNILMVWKSKVSMARNDD